MLLSNPNIKAEGRITVEYTDGVTGEVKNRFQSENHAFPAGFLRNNNYILGNTSNNDYIPFSIILSDRGDNIDYNIPVVPGNIIGYGYPGSSANGNRVGAENTAARSLGVYSNGKWHYKRQWSWLPSQVPSEIKSFGISPIVAGDSNTSNHSRWHMCPYQIPYTGKSDYSMNVTMALYDYGVGYLFNSMYFYGPNNLYSDRVYVYPVMKDGSYYTKELRNIIPKPSDLGSGSNAYFTSNGSCLAAVDLATGDILIMILYRANSEEAKVQLTRLDVNLTEVKDNTIYSCGTYTNESNQYPFTGYGTTQCAVGYYSNGKFYSLYGENNTGFCKVAKINPSAWSASGDFMDSFTFTDTPYNHFGYRPHAQNGAYLSVYGGYPMFYTPYSRMWDLSSGATNTQCLVVMNPQTNEAYASKYAYISTYSNYYFGMPLMCKINDTNVILQHMSNSYGSDCIDGDDHYWRNLSDYTLYVLPDNAPKREEGQGVTITYEIAWGYE